MRILTLSNAQELAQDIEMSQHLAALREHLDFELEYTTPAQLQAMQEAEFKKSQLEILESVHAARVAAAAIAKNGQYSR